MDALDLVLSEKTPLAIEKTTEALTRVRYYEGQWNRQAVLRRLRIEQMAAEPGMVVSLAFLAQPSQGERGWAPLQPR